MDERLAFVEALRSLVEAQSLSGLGGVRFADNGGTVWWKHGAIPASVQTLCDHSVSSHTSEGIDFEISLATVRDSYAHLVGTPEFMTAAVTDQSFYFFTFDENRVSTFGLACPRTVASPGGFAKPRVQVCRNG